MLIKNCSLILYQLNQSKPLLLELETEFFSSLNTHNVPNTFDQFNSSTMLYSFMRGLVELDYGRDRMVQRIIQSKLQTCFDSFRLGKHLDCLTRALNPINDDNDNVITPTSNSLLFKNTVTFIKAIGEFRSFIIRNYLSNFECEIPFVEFSLYLLKSFYTQSLLNGGMSPAKCLNAKWLSQDFLFHYSSPLVWWSVSITVRFITILYYYL